MTTQEFVDWLTEAASGIVLPGADGFAVRDYVRGPGALTLDFEDGSTVYVNVRGA